MTKGIIVKLVVLNVLLIFGVIFILSDMFLGFELGHRETFKSVIAITTLVMAFIIFCYGNFRILKEIPLLIKNESVVIIESYEECLSSLKEHNNKEVFKKEVQTLTKETHRFFKKKNDALSFIQIKFTDSSLTYNKYVNTINAVESLFYKKIKSILSKIIIFDEEDFSYIQSCDAQSQLDPSVLSKKKKIFNDYISNVREGIQINEEIILKLDNLLYEISSFTNIDENVLKNSQAMKEINTLIKNTKLYR